MSERARWNSVLASVLLLALCVAVGMVVLPLVFGPTPSGLATFVWLAAGVVDAVLVIVLAVELSGPLAGAIARGAGSSGFTPSQSVLLARLLMVGLAVVAGQAVLRRPIGVLLGGDRSVVPIEAGIAAAALALVLALLVWVYQTARPMVQALTLRAIDAAIPTVGVEPLLAEPTRTAPSLAGALEGALQGQTTVVAPHAAAAAGAAGATLLAARGGDATVTAQPVNSLMMVRKQKQPSIEPTEVRSGGSAEERAVATPPPRPGEGASEAAAHDGEPPVLMQPVNSPTVVRSEPSYEATVVRPSANAATELARQEADEQSVGITLARTPSQSDT